MKPTSLDDRRLVETRRVDEMDTDGQDLPTRTLT